MGFFDKLLNVGDAVGQGLVAKEQAEVANEEREAEERRRVLEEALLTLRTDQERLDYTNAKNPRPEFDVTPNGVSVRNVRDPAQAAKYAEQYGRKPEPPEAVNWQTVQTPTGYMQVNPRTGETRPIMHGGAQVTPPPDVDAGGMGRMPTVTQQALTQVGPVLSALDRYEQAARQYMTHNPVGRVAGAFGLPSGMDREIGQLQSMQSAVLLSIKNLAELGVLNGPDQQIVTDMIGDPLSMQASIRNPEFTLARIAEARRFIEDKVNAISSMYGVEPPASGPAGAPPAATPAQTGVGPLRTGYQPMSGPTPNKPAWQRRADELKASGMSPDEIAATLRQEGLVSAGPQATATAGRPRPYSGLNR